MQNWLDVQSVSCVHVAGQTLPAQAPPGQLMVWALGHWAPDPVQFAGSVATPAVQLGPRHWKLGGWKPSAGHDALDPEHVSGTSQPPLAATRHTVP